MKYNENTIDNLVETLKNSIIEQENSSRSPLNTSYDNGILDGSHDVMIDVLNLLGVPHNFKHIAN